MNYSKLEKTIKDQNLTLKKIAEKIGRDNTGIYTTFKNKTLSINDLENIAKVLNKPIGYFFDEENIEDLDIWPVNLISLVKIIFKHDIETIDNLCKIIEVIKLMDHENNNH